MSISQFVVIKKKKKKQSQQYLNPQTEFANENHSEGEHVM